MAAPDRTAIDVVTGEVRWDREVVWAAVTPDAAVVLDGDGRVTGPAAGTGEPMWEITSDSPPEELRSGLRVRPTARSVGDTFRHLENHEALREPRPFSGYQEVTP